MGTQSERLPSKECQNGEMYRTEDTKPFTLIVKVYYHSS